MQGGQEGNVGPFGIPVLHPLTILDHQNLADRPVEEQTGPVLTLVGPLAHAPLGQRQDCVDQGGTGRPLQEPNPGRSRGVILETARGIIHPPSTEQTV
jgi:hypothetical protein